MYSKGYNSLNQFKFYNHNGTTKPTQSSVEGWKNTSLQNTQRNTNLTDVHKIHNKIKVSAVIFKLQIYFGVPS